MGIKAQEIIDKINELGKAGSNKTEVAKALGLNRMYLHRLINKMPTVKEAFDQKKQEFLDELTASVQERALNGDTTLSIFYLKTQGGWSEISHIEHGGEVNIIIKRDNDNN